jgi:hypothetical protein
MLDNLGWNTFLIFTLMMPETFLKLHKFVQWKTGFRQMRDENGNKEMFRMQNTDFVYIDTLENVKLWNDIYLQLLEQLQSLCRQ